MFKKIKIKTKLDYYRIPKTPEFNPKILCPGSAILHMATLPLTGSASLACLNSNVTVITLRILEVAMFCINYLAGLTRYDRRPTTNL